MFKSLTIIYIVCLFCYVLFSRVPDFFDGEYVNGVVSKASFSAKDNHPVLAVKYKVGQEEFEYVTSTWFFSSHRKGEILKMIYSPSHPAIANIYTFIGYWITLKELFFTALVFIALFIVAVIITGHNNNNPTLSRHESRKRKYDD